MIGPRDSGFSERGLIARIRELAQGGAVSAGLVQGIGDDCAVFRAAGPDLWLVTTDTLVEAVHFDLAWHPPRQLGRKCAAVNISDVAAMGGAPCFALLNLAVPPTCTAVWLDDFLAGFTEVLQEHRVILIGGDTVESGRPAVFSVTVIGAAVKGRVLYRSGASPGDSIWVSGPLGEAAAGLEFCRRGIRTAKWQRLIEAHLDPSPLVQLGQILAGSGLVHAMIDLSDGLATDLAHLGAASGAGAEIDAARLPLSELLVEAAAFLEMPPLDWALKGGEDYQLLFTAPAAHDEALPRLVSERLARPIFRLGRITDDRGVFLCRQQGTDPAERLDISFQGYEHFAGGGKG